MAFGSGFHTEVNLKQKFLHINWGLVLLICLIAAIGISALYSAGNGDFSRWAGKHLIRFGVGMFGMVIIALIDIRFWHRMSYLIFIAGFLMLIAVEVMGHVGMGAQRWINLGFMKLQPSELMKIAVIMALARYFHVKEPGDLRNIVMLIPAAILIFLPVGLVLLQPDLGTSLMIVFGGAAMFWIAGAPGWLFAAGIVIAAVSAPVVWHFMHSYQKQRVLTFLNPESDPLGSGYHITQSKIALGSGGVRGKGFMEGSQSHLNFLPEKQTDFIFTLWAEEWGLAGGVFLLISFAMIFVYCGWIAFRCRQRYTQLLAFGLMVNFSLYVIINIAMVMGLIPVVGVPLPLISYGGTSMLAALISFGLIISCSIHKDSKIPRI